MRNHRATERTAWKELLLATTGVVTIVTPVVVGMLNAPRLHAQSSPIVANSPAFEVASIKPTKSSGLPPFVRSPGRWAVPQRRPRGQAR